MSFAGEVKKEILLNPPAAIARLRAQAYGMLLFGRSFGASSISLQTENKAVADLYVQHLFDLVELYLEDDEDTETVQVVTTVRCDPRQGRISKESPMGKQLLCKQGGDRFEVTTECGYSYFVKVQSITKSQDDGTAPIL